MGRVADLANTIRELKDLLPLIKEFMECFREFSPEQQKAALRIVGKRLNDEEAEALLFMVAPEIKLEQIRVS